MLPMKLGDPTPALMSAPSVPRSDADNGIIAPPLLVPAGTEGVTYVWPRKYIYVYLNQCLNTMYLFSCVFARSGRGREDKF